MQKQPNAAELDELGPLNSPLAVLANPKVVLMAAGALGLAIDLFVRPLSWVGLALLVLATMPWTLQAWSERVARTPERDLGPTAAKPGVAADPAARPRAEPQIVASPPKPGTARPEPRAAAATPTRPAAAAGRPIEGEPRPAPVRPQRFAETPSAARPVRPETAG
jgi:hypothetical protein